MGNNAAMWGKIRLMAGPGARCRLEIPAGGSGLGSFCEIGKGGKVVIDFLEPAAPVAVLRAVGGAYDSIDVADAKIGKLGSFGQDLIAEEALGLEAAEFGGRFIKKTAGLGAGAVDGSLAAIGGVIVHGGHGGFNVAAAAETPHGTQDLFDQVFFHEGGGAEFGVEGFFEFGIDCLLSRADMGAGSKEAGRNGVFGRSRLAGFRGGASGRLSVGCVGSELGWGGHRLSPLKG